MSTIKILVIDDKKENLELAVKQFEDKEVVLLTAPSFAIASDLIKFHDFKMVLTDLMLPGESEGVSSTNAAIGQDTPYGLVLAIMAKNKGVPHVAIVTDINHHASPIAWAMDQILGKQAFVSAYGDSRKGWLKVAEAFISIPEKSRGKAQNSSEKKVLMLAGLNDGYKKLLQKELQNSFEIIYSPESQNADVLPIYVEKKPDVIIVIGELDENAYKYDQTKLFNNLKKVKQEQQRIFIMGFTKSDDPDYVRLPITGDALKEKLGLVSVQ